MENDRIVSKKNKIEHNKAILWEYQNRIYDRNFIW